MVPVALVIVVGCGRLCGCYSITLWLTVDADEVHHEDIATPGRHHIYVGEARHHREHVVVRLAEGAAPEVVGRAHGGHGDRLVIVPTADGAHDVRRDDRHDGGGGDTGVGRVGALHRKHAEEERGDSAEPRGHVAAH